MQRASVVTAHGFSSCGSQALEHRLNSFCGTQIYLLHGMWDLPGSAIEPVSLALAGKFFTLEPLPYSGKPKTPLLIEDKKLFLKKCKVFVSSGLAIAMLYEFPFLFLEWCLY